MVTAATEKKPSARRTAPTETTSADGDAAHTAPIQAVAGPSRREFLHYIWGASMLLLLGQATAGLVWYSLPHSTAGEFGGEFRLSPDLVPLVGEPPRPVPEGRFHLVNTEAGLLALYSVCTHLSCLTIWNPTLQRFECPCHGSRFEPDGRYVEGPAPRSLDRFAMTVIFADGNTLTTDNRGSPLALAGRAIAEIIVDTGHRIDSSGAS